MTTDDAVFRQGHDDALACKPPASDFEELVAPNAYDAGYQEGLVALQEHIEAHRTGPEPAASREGTLKHLRERIDFETARLARLTLEWWNGPCPPYSLDPRAIAWRSEERKLLALMRAHEVLSAST